MTRRAVVLVDGEHYPPTVRAALDALRAGGTRPVAALFLGGSEKVSAKGAAVDLGVPSQWATTEADGSADVAAAATALRELCAREHPDVVVDLSDEPVLDPRKRLQLAAHVLHAGWPYEAPDVTLSPPPRPRLAAVPSIAVIGTGKRSGKTAFAGELTRRLTAGGYRPAVVAMGRGGPDDPVVVPAGADLDPAALLAVADAGGHAASDFYEDAVTTGAATVGARRCGGGLAGAVGFSNVAAAVQAAGHLDADLLVLEGSGSAVPPVHADAGVLVVPADCDPEFVRGYLGAYRVLLADLVVVTMVAPPRGSPRRVTAVLEAIRSISRRPPVLRTVLHPVPLGPVSGDQVFFATTAPAPAGAALAASLERRYGCQVVGMSSHLADRPALRADLDAAPAFDVLLVELKAAAVDVAARSAARAGARVVFCDNRPAVVGVDDDAEGAGTAMLQDAVARLARLAGGRFAAR